MTVATLPPRWERSGRLVGVVRGERPGTTLVITGALHGNEPAGLEAGRAVLERLERGDLPLSGSVVVLAGNLGAMEAGRRFLDRDLNRRWDEASLEQLRRTAAAPRHREDPEQLELARAFEMLVADSPDGIAYLDLHSTSAGARPFAVVCDIAHNLHLARALRLPIILGFDRFVDGPVLDWWHGRGLRAVGIEGGRHDDPRTPIHLEAIVWSALVGIGGLREEELPRDTAEPREETALRPDEPWCFHILHRHGVSPGDGFRMRAGFASFQPVRVGQILADDRRGPIRAPRSGLVFLPLYQDQGTDGFFLVEPVEP